jgi:putative ATP-binding cassette transporter
VVTSLSLSLGLLSNIVSLCSFVTILWGLSGALKFTWFNHHFSIAGYMVWVALIYAVIGTYITFKIGQPLIKLNFKQENLEADFRFGLMRVREYSENIAFYRGEAQEQQQLTNKFNVLISNFLATVYQQIKIDIVNVAYSQIANIFPVLVSAPRYFAKVIQLGDVMQIAGAFGHVQGSLSYFIDAYSSLAGLRAVIWRLQEFDHVVEQSHQLVNLYDIHQVTTDENYLVLRHLSVYLPSQQQILLRNVNLKLTSGERLLIQGPSGCGKTTLLRTLAGLWPYAEGEIIHKSNLRELFIGQRPYLPAVSLRDALYYPETANKLANLNIKLEQLLQQCGLMHLIHQLDNIVEWNKILSLGEQQRLAFIRILLQKPDIIYLDEATSALDEAMEALLYQLITQQLPRSLIISIGHRSSLNQWHTQQFYFPRD